MDRNNYIEIHPTQAQVAKIFYHHPSKYLNQNVFPQLQYLLFRIMCLFSEKWVSKQVLNDHNLLCSLQCKKHFDLYHEHIWLHQCQEDINSLYHFERIPGNIPGTYVSLKSEIIRYIKNHVNPETDKIKIKISEDGSKIFCLSSGKSWYEDLLDDGLKSTLAACPSVLSNFKYWGTRP
jgi:hypothetical protein